jgi:fumarate hydratase subunit beta
VHLAAVGGAGAYLSQFICQAEQIAYEDLGPEAIFCLIVRGFPAFVAYDSHGGSIYVKDTE